MIRVMWPPWRSSRSPRRPRAGPDELLVSGPGAGSRLVDLSHAAVGSAIGDVKFATWSRDGTKLIANVGGMVVVMKPDGRGAGWPGTVQPLQPAGAGPGSHPRRRGRDPGGRGAAALAERRTGRIAPGAGAAARSPAGCGGRGARVRYRLSAAGRVAFRVQRLRGRRAPRVVGRFTPAGRAGEHAFLFTGRLGGRALRPGRYRLVATAGGVTRRVVFSVRR